MLALNLASCFFSSWYCSWIRLWWLNSSIVVERKKLMGNRDFLKYSCCQSSICKSGRAVQVEGFMFPEESGGWLKKTTDRWCLSSGQMSTANKAIPVRREDAFFLLYKVLSGVLGSTLKWRGTGRERLWEKPLSLKYPLMVLGLPYTSENKNGSWRYGLEKRSWPTWRFKSCTHMGYILYISHWHWTNQDRASHGRRKKDVQARNYSHGEFETVF